MAEYVKQCSYCYHSGEMYEFKKNRFRCLNCGATIDKGGDITFTDNPACTDNSATGFIRILFGGILFIGACVQGLAYEGQNLGLIGGGLLIWGWYVRKKRFNDAKYILEHYPYWNEGDGARKKDYLLARNH